VTRGVLTFDFGVGMPMRSTYPVEEHVMRSRSRTAISATLVAATVTGGTGMAPSARAYNPAISGTYTATLVGEWARTNTVYRDEPLVRSTG